MRSSPRSSGPRWRRWLVVLLCLAVALPGGYYVARHVAWPAYKQWREDKLVRMTESFMKAGDYDNALLTVRRALRDNQRNVANWKLAAAAAKAKGTSDVIYYQQNVARLEQSLESQLELIRLALQYGDVRDALDTVENINPAARTSAEFHELAAQTYLRLNRPLAAKTNLYSLVELRPGDQKARLDLAELELDEDGDGKNPKVRADIEALSRESELRVRALSLLLGDAVERQDGAAATKFARQLQAMPGLTGEQRAQVLAGLALGAPEEAEAYRRSLQAAIANDPAGVVALANYCRTSGSRDEARRWFDSLPPATRQDARVQEAIAAAYLEWKDWRRLDAVVSAGPWKDREFMRQAFTAYSARQNGRMADAGSAWRLAVLQAGDSVRNTSELLGLVGRWGWQNEQYDLVWKLFALMPRNEAISRQLIAWEYHQGHTANLNRIYGRLAEFAGDDRMVKNNFAYSSLLLDANLSRATEIAQNNYTAEPTNPYYVTTQAFALFKRNKPADALALLETLRPALLSTPERTALHALLRATTGDAAGAADLLSGVRAAVLLPEERQLLTRAGEQVARLNREKGEDRRLDALVQRGGIDHRKGWLEALTGVDRSSVTLEMQAADSLYAMGDLAGLGAQLRHGSWGEWDHVRLALIAYVARQRGDVTEARSYWRTALGTAATNVAQLKQLEQLAELWNWRPEKMDALTRRFSADADDREAFAALTNYYRANGRTAELVGVLTTYLTAHPGDQTQAADLAYYSMLSGLNVTRAYVAAQEAYQAAPRDPQRRLIYAFALWKQRRPQEAWDLLDGLTADEKSPVPTALIRAAVLADMERKEDAARALQAFDRSRALPEEANLAVVVASKLKGDSRVSRLN